MKLTVIGTGYVGLVAGTCFADLGNDVICMDVDAEKIVLLEKGETPIYEPGLKDVLQRTIREKRLTFTTDIKKAVQASDVIFIAVGTPSKENGGVDLQYFEQVAKDIAEHMNGFKIIVDKSTVPVGTGNYLKELILKHQKEKHDFEIVSNPEFLREGQAMKDFMQPDRIVIGLSSPESKAKPVMEKLYSGLVRSDKPFIFTSLETAELAKYASNAMLATRISFMNELSWLSEKVSADIKQVAHCMGLDDRIGPRFLQAGTGFGGSCFPKDVKALRALALENEIALPIVDAVLAVNEKQKIITIEKVEQALGTLEGKTLAVLGLAFKPNTDDIREAPSQFVIPSLLAKKAKVRVFDPEAMPVMKKQFPDLFYADSVFQAVTQADAIIVLTEWDEFRSLDWETIASLVKQKIVVDGRNIFNPQVLKANNFTYIGIGR